MTVHARIDDDVARPLVFFGTPLRHPLLHSADAALSLPLVQARALAVKRMVDAEMWRGTRPSIALGQLAATADRVQADPGNATAELRALRGRLGVVRLHTAGLNTADRRSRRAGCRCLAAWLQLA